MTRSLSRAQAVWLGLVVCTALALGGWGLLRIGQSQGLIGPTFDVDARLTQAAGITPGTPVRLRGVPVGQVIAVELPDADETDRRVRLQLRLQRRQQGNLFADAAVSLRSEGLIGSRFVEIDPGSPENGPLAADTVLSEKPSRDLTVLVEQSAETMKRADDLIRRVHANQDRLVRETTHLLTQINRNQDRLSADAAETLRELNVTLKTAQGLMTESRETVTSVKQSTAALKKMPLVRSYVPEGEAELLIRPAHDRERLVYDCQELFEPERVVLSETGRQKLAEAAQFLNERRWRGSDIVIVAYSDPKADEPTSVATARTRKQAEAVLYELQTRHKVHRLSGSWGLLSATRKLSPLGMGPGRSPVPDKDSLPSNRIEVILFWPQG